MLVDFVSGLHTSTKRDYSLHMPPDKPDCMAVSRKYGKDYWDGDRKYGFGGYRNDGRWASVAKEIIDFYGLTSKSRVLDIGCGKGFLAHEILKRTNCDILGCDISDYAVDNCWVDCQKFDVGKYQLCNEYDLILCVNVLHNLQLPQLKHALQMISAHSDKSYICMDSYRNEKELHNLQCWALTAEQFFRPEEWEFLFDQWGYKGDWEYIFFE